MSRSHPDWLTPARQRILEDEYPAGVVWPKLWLHLTRTDPDAPRPPKRCNLTSFANNHGLYRPGNKHRQWTDDEVLRLRNLAARHAERDELIAAFPGFSYRRIDILLHTLGLPHPPRRHSSAKSEKPTRRRDTEMHCLCCGKSFMSWDRCRNRLCVACSEAAGSVTIVDVGCHVRLEA